MTDAGRIMVIPKGKYNASTTYEKLDAVTYNGQGFIALKTVSGVTPTDDGTNWRLYVDNADIDASNLAPTFTVASTRENIASKEKMPKILGKIAKWFSDLKTVAFSGSYNDLSDKPIVDANISLASTNPVQNKVVTGNLIDIRKETTVNLLKPTLQTVTVNGVTCTNNGDGTYTLNGTATVIPTFFIVDKLAINKGSYKVARVNDSNSSVSCSLRSKDGNSILADQDGIAEISEDTEAWFYVRIGDKTALSNVIIKPMFTTNLSATYDDFVPYTGDTGKLNGDVAALKAYADKMAGEGVDFSVSTSKALHDTVEAPLVLNKATRNLLPISSFNTSTQNGVTITNNGDGTYTLNGTATSEIIFVFLRDEQGKLFYKNIVGKTLKFLNGGSINPPVGRFLFTLRDGNKWWTKGEHYDNSIFTVSEGYSQVTIDLHIYKGQTVTDLIVKPMVTTDLEATINDFVPYSGYDIKTIGKNIIGNPSKFNSPTVKDGIITFPAKKVATNDTYLRLYSDVDISVFDTFRVVVESINESINDPDKSYVLIKTAGKKEFSTLTNTSFESSANKYVSNVFNCSDFGNKIDEITVVVRNGYAYSGGSYKVSIFNGEDKEFSNWVKYVESSVHIDSSTEFPLLGLKSFNGETNIISPGNVEVTYAKSDSGKAILGMCKPTVKNLVATVEGNPLDATMGAQLKKELDELKTKVDAMSTSITE